MPRRLTLKYALTAALAASVLTASQALAKPMPGPPSPAAYTLDDGRSPDTRDAAKDAAVQPGQPTWPVNPRTLKPPAEGSVRGGRTDNDDIWLVVGIGLSGVALAGGVAGAARYTRGRARRVAV